MEFASEDDYMAEINKLREENKFLRDTQERKSELLCKVANVAMKFKAENAKLRDALEEIKKAQVIGHEHIDIATRALEGTDGQQ